MGLTSPKSKVCTTNRMGCLIPSLFGLSVTLSTSGGVRVATWSTLVRDEILIRDTRGVICWQDRKGTVHRLNELDDGHLTGVIQNLRGRNRHDLVEPFELEMEQRILNWSGHAN